jgi:hypothetical protein
VFVLIGAIALLMLAPAYRRHRSKSDAHSVPA